MSAIVENRRKVTYSRAARRMLSASAEAPERMENDTIIYPVLRRGEEEQVLRGKVIPKFPPDVELRLTRIERQIEALRDSFARSFEALVAAHAELQTAFLEDATRRRF